MITSGRRTIVPLFLVGAVLALGAGACGTSDEQVATLISATTSVPSPSIRADTSTTATPSTAPVPATLSSAPISTAPAVLAPVTAAGRAAEPEGSSARTPSPPASASAVARHAGSSTGAQVVALTNSARTDAGCDALAVDQRLTKAAQGHSDDMAEQSYFSHDSQDGTTFDERIERAGYASPGGENIARGQRSAADVVEAWLESPGHRANIENCSFTTIGVGHSAEGDYWTQDFGR